MPFEIRTLKFMVPLVGSLFLAAACSSGSDPSSDTTLAGFLGGPSDPDGDNSDAQNIARQTSAAAAAAPIGTGTTGGVSQTSDGGTTPAEFLLSQNTDEVTTFEITLGGASTYTIDTTADLAGAGTNTNLVQNEGAGNIVTFEQTLGVTESVPDGTGTLHVWAKTDTPNSVGNDVDYLAYGFWIHDPVDTAAIDPIIGAFVDASDGVVFAYDSLALLSGTATYTGAAEGVYHEQIPVADEDPTSRFAAWTATASLSAVFGTTDVIDATDIISGEIDTFVGLPDGVAVTTVTLGDATLPLAAASDEGGFFTGATMAEVTVDIDGTDTDIDFTGTWGGKFYDDLEGTDAAANYPGTVAGTFGLAGPATADTYRAFLGIFHADLDTD